MTNITWNTKYEQKVVVVWDSIKNHGMTTVCRQNHGWEQAIDFALELAKNDVRQGDVVSVELVNSTDGQETSRMFLCKIAGFC